MYTYSKAKHTLAGHVTSSEKRVSPKKYVWSMCGVLLNHCSLGSTLDRHLAILNTHKKEHKKSDTNKLERVMASQITRKRVGVSNGPVQFESARKIWPLLELLPKIR